MIKDYKEPVYGIGIQSFEDLRNRGCIYVDKTKYIHMLTQRGKYYFLSRPRRFGKSLFVSTLEAFFLGKRHLFKGLYIDSVEKDWIKYPVLHFDLNAQDYSRSDALKQILNLQLQFMEEDWDLTPNLDSSPESRFIMLIRHIYQKAKKKIVILIDEYDKPLLKTVDNPDLQEEFRNQLRGFYGVLKTMDPYIQFAFITGVGHFSKVSIFSDLNNLNVISFDLRYSGICGIEETELVPNFRESIRYLSGKLNRPEEDTLSELKKRYDGYHFATPEICEGIFNPFSLLSVFDKLELGNYWFDTGTPDFLAQLVAKHNLNLTDLGEIKASKDQLKTMDLSLTNPVPILYQTGYLTLKKTTESGNFILGFPNDEVEESFYNYLIQAYVAQNFENNMFAASLLADDVLSGDIDDFVKRVNALFADLPYDIIPNEEKHFQTIMVLLVKMLGFYVEAEYRTSDGRIDMVVKSQKYIYVFEFKFNGSAEDALNQIDTKGYLLPFKADGRKLYKIGMNFSKEQRRISEIIVKEG